MAAELREPTELLTVGTWRGDVASYLMHYGSRCRDCADEDGVCPASGLPCEVPAAKKAIAHVLAAINYGVAQGYLALREREIETGTSGAGGGRFGSYPSADTDTGTIGAGGGGPSYYLGPDKDKP